MPHFLHQTAFEHRGAPRIESPIQHLPIGQQPEFKYPITLQRVTALTKQLANWPPRQQANLECAHNLRHVIRMNLPRAGPVESGEEPVQGSRASFLSFGKPRAE